VTFSFSFGLELGLGLGAQLLCQRQSTIFIVSCTCKTNRPSAEAHSLLIYRLVQLPPANTHSAAFENSGNIHLAFMATDDDIYSAFPALSYNSHNLNALAKKQNGSRKEKLRYFRVNIE